jgi:hypothetical protein
VDFDACQDWRNYIQVTQLQLTQQNQSSKAFYKVAALALFSLLCAYGMTTTALVHHAKQKPSLLTTAVDSFHRVNTL